MTRTHSGGDGVALEAATAEVTAALQGAQISRRRPDFTLPRMHANLRLSSNAPLVDASDEGGAGRVLCERCDSTRRYFCHVCLASLVHPTPEVRLPCRVVFVTDAKEKPSKATGVHCAVLAPRDVSLCRPEDLPPDIDPRRAVLLFPEDGASTVAEVVAEVRAARVHDDDEGGDGGEGDGGDGDGDGVGDDSKAKAAQAAGAARAAKRRRLDGIDAVIVIDSKWDGATLISRSSRLAALPRVRLARHRTAFWRFHPQPRSLAKRDVRDAKKRAGADDGDERLCSLEALFFFARELHEAGFGGASGDRCAAVRRARRETGAREKSPSSSAAAAAESESASDGCHCHDDLFWFFAHLHAAVAKAAATREYHPMKQQAKKGRSARRSEKRREAGREAGGEGRGEEAPGASDGGDEGGASDGGDEGDGPG